MIKQPYAWVNVEESEDGYLIELVEGGYERDISHTQNKSHKNAIVRKYQLIADELNASNTGK